MRRMFSADVKMSCRLNKARMRSGDSECSADGVGTPRSPVNLRSISLVERGQSTTDSQGDDQGANSGLQMTRQTSVSSVLSLYCVCNNLFYPRYSLSLPIEII